jgi:AraC family transcriptional regulator of adaptative response / DNA-3-methyladenine glycosylase II
MDLASDACYRALRTRDPRFDGRFFVGVSTTGIYCRPICPSRTPKRQHVTFYPSAAAAQSAGFRPCLRCRPETAPDLNAWRGSSNTIARALPLIEMGALDDGNVDALAGRLGVGDRQLRRLFLRHLGATPVAVAQARRVHLAKQLIHDTTLPMTQVALASGYGSLRRFNEAFHDLFGRPPSALRAGTRETPHAGPAGAVTVRLRYRPPYDWDGILSFLAARAIPGVETVDDGTYARTFALDGRHGVVSVQPAPGHALDATVSFPIISALPLIVARLRRVFDLAADPDAIAGHLGEDPLLTPLVAARPGLRVPGAWDPFELAVRAILGQQVSVAAAVTLAGQLVAAYGQPLSARSEPTRGLSHVFPAPDRLARADLAALRMPGARKAAIRALAAAVAKRPGTLAAGHDLDATITALRALPGIGEWTAQYIAMRALQEPDAFPAADAGLLRAVERLTGSRPAPAALLARAERWRPWRAYAALWLWGAA